MEVGESDFKILTGKPTKKETLRKACSYKKGQYENLS
jgi:hypothetical protein